MKSIICLISLLLFINLSGFTQVKMLSFKGKVYAYGETLKDATVEVFQAGDLVFETKTKGGGKFDFELEAEKQYMVEVSKEDMRAKVIWINTKGTQQLGFKVPSFGFDVYLKKEKISPYDELSEIPVTLIKYQAKKKEFYMDKNYSDAVKNKKQRIKDNSLQLR